MFWGFGPGRAKASTCGDTDATLRRMEAHSDSAVVPFVWQVEVANALGEAVVHGKVPLGRALEIWDARKLSSPIDNYLSGSFHHW